MHATAQAAQVLRSFGYSVLRNHGSRTGRPYRVWGPQAQQHADYSLRQLNQLAAQLLEGQA